MNQNAVLWSWQSSGQSSGQSAGRLGVWAVMIALLAGGLAVTGQPTDALAQQVIRVQQGEQSDAAADETDEETEERPQLRTLPPAYDAQMLNLAEALGSLHYLRQLCGANEGQLWREEMEKMLDSENPSPERRAQLIASFNRGFRSYREIYRECTLPAAEAANRFLTRGMRLAAEIPGRYGR